MSNTVKRLYRSQTNRWLFGVCGGIGEYFNLDPILIRALFVALALLFGGGFLIYIILIIIIPLEPTAPAGSEDFTVVDGEDSES